MNYFFITGLVIALIVITFLLLIFMPTPNCYFSFDEIGSELAQFSLKDNFKIIVDEIADTTYDNGIRMLYQNDTVHDNFASHPKLYELLRTVPNVERVFLKHVPKKTKSKKRRGCAESSNNSLRCVLPIDIPAAKKSGMWLDGESRLYRDMDWIIYDNSRESSFYNKHKRLDLYLLVIDITRPKSIPMGISLEETGPIF